MVFALQAIDGVSKVLLRISIVTMDYHGLKPPSKPYHDTTPIVAPWLTMGCL